MASGNTLAVFKPYMNEPTSTNYATLATRNLHPVLQFDTTTQETAIFSGKMPQNYAGGNIIAIADSTAASATSGTIGWDITFENMTGQDIDADGFATAQTITAATVNGTSGILTSSSVTITAGSTGTDSVVAGDNYRVRVRRDVANDTATGDAELISLELREA